MKTMLFYFQIVYKFFLKKLLIVKFFGEIRLSLFFSAKLN